ncbi:hypothetical protein AAHA92_02683 [Salvia divinorum]|uniref:Uncharacterized protein n=1 Tax=Salvia divinorum TaxID=28513 RepID=A0ABD1IEP8_SALDI
MSFGQWRHPRGQGQRRAASYKAAAVLFVQRRQQGAGVVPDSPSQLPEFCRQWVRQVASGDVDVGMVHGAAAGVHRQRGRGRGSDCVWGARAVAGVQDVAIEQGSRRETRLSGVSSSLSGPCKVRNCIVVLY